MPLFDVIYSFHSFIIFVHEPTKISAYCSQSFDMVDVEDNDE